MANSPWLFNLLVSFKIHHCLAALFSCNWSYLPKGQSVSKLKWLRFYYFQLFAAKTVISGFKAPSRPLDPTCGVQLLSEGVQNYVWCWNSRLYLFRFGLLWIPRNVYDQTRNLARFGHLTLVLRSLLRCHYQRHCRHVYR